MFQRGTALSEDVLRLNFPLLGPCRPKLLGRPSCKLDVPGSWIVDLLNKTPLFDAELAFADRHLIFYRLEWEI